MSVDLETPLGFASFISNAANQRKVFVPCSFNMSKILKSVGAQESIDLVCDQDFFEVELPPVIKVRSMTCTVIMYGFVDASGSGFGSTLLTHANIKYRIGTWLSKEENNSSN